MTRLFVGNLPTAPAATDVATRLAKIAGAQLLSVTPIVDLGTGDINESVSADGRTVPSFMQKGPAASGPVAKAIASVNGLLWQGRKLRVERADEGYMSKLEAEWKASSEAEPALITPLITSVFVLGSGKRKRVQHVYSQDNTSQPALSTAEDGTLSLKIRKQRGLRSIKVRCDPIDSSLEAEATEANRLAAMPPAKRAKQRANLRPRALRLQFDAGLVSSSYPPSLLKDGMSAVSSLEAPHGSRGQGRGVCEDDGGMKEVEPEEEDGGSSEEEDQESEEGKDEDKVEQEQEQDPVGMGIDAEGEAEGVEHELEQHEDIAIDAGVVEEDWEQSAAGGEDIAIDAEVVEEDWEQSAVGGVGALSAVMDEAIDDDEEEEEYDAEAYKEYVPPIHVSVLVCGEDSGGQVKGGVSLASIPLSQSQVKVRPNLDEREEEEEEEEEEGQASRDQDDLLDTLKDEKASHLAYLARLFGDPGRDSEIPSQAANGAKVGGASLLEGGTAGAGEAEGEGEKTVEFNKGVQGIRGGLRSRRTSKALQAVSAPPQPGPVRVRAPPQPGPATTAQLSAWRSLVYGHAAAAAGRTQQSLAAALDKAGKKVQGDTFAGFKLLAAEPGEGRGAPPAYTLPAREGVAGTTFLAPHTAHVRAYADTVWRASSLFGSGEGEGGREAVSEEAGRVAPSPPPRAQAGTGKTQIRAQQVRMARPSLSAASLLASASAFGAFGTSSTGPQLAGRASDVRLKAQLKSDAHLQAKRAISSSGTRGGRGGRGGHAQRR